MSAMQLQIINGPNLNLLGTREPSIYGATSFDAFYLQLKAKYPQIDLYYFQSNVEGELINKIQEVGFSYDGIIINGGAYTHTSIAIADAIKAISSPCIEVHISQIYAREAYRHVSYLGANCKGSISGFGLQSYDLAIQSFL
jgi:3-dehydroquinate dehydratase-2